MKRGDGMVGVVLVSHGGMAEGILSSAEMLCPNLSQVACIGLCPADDPDDFQAKLSEKIKEVDSGDGVFVLADLMGGTPCNRSMYLLGENVRVLAGMNLAMLVTLLTSRDDASDIKSLAEEVLEEAHGGILDVNELMNKRQPRDGETSENL